MAKTATFAMRLDEDLKRDAQDVLDNMGIPMSLAVEMFLRQVVANGKLPFTIGDDGSDEEEEALRESREHDFWQSFILWYFKVWPVFDSMDTERRAREELGFTGRGAGRLAEAYIVGDTRGRGDRMTEEQREAAVDLHSVSSLLSEAKELIYWALDMDRVFVPSLSARYSGEADGWRYRLLRRQSNSSQYMFDDDGEEDDELMVAHGVVGARWRRRRILTVEDSG